MLSKNHLIFPSLFHFFFMFACIPSELIHTSTVLWSPVHNENNTHQITILQPQKLRRAHIFMHSVVIRQDTFPVDRCLPPSILIRPFLALPFFWGGGVSSDSQRGGRNYANSAFQEKFVAKTAGWEKGKGQRTRGKGQGGKLTSAEHFATAAAKVSIGRVRPGIDIARVCVEVNTRRGMG